MLLTNALQKSKIIETASENPWHLPGRDNIDAALGFGAWAMLWTQMTAAGGGLARHVAIGLTLSQRLHDARGSLEIITATRQQRPTN